MSAALCKWKKRRPKGTGRTAKGHGQAAHHIGAKREGAHPSRRLWAALHSDLVGSWGGAPAIASVGCRAQEGGYRDTQLVLVHPSSSGRPQSGSGREASAVQRLAHRHSACGPRLGCLCNPEVGNEQVAALQTFPAIHRCSPKLRFTVVIVVSRPHALRLNGRLLLAPAARRPPRPRTASHPSSLRALPSPPRPPPRRGASCSVGPPGAGSSAPGAAWRRPAPP